MPHVHNLRNGQVTGKDEIRFEGDHVHKLPNGELTDPADEGPTHTHRLPDGSNTPSGPVTLGELKDDENGDEAETNKET